MRILYAGQRFDYGSKSRGLSYEHYAFHDSLVAMGHTVIPYDTGAMKKRYGLATASEKFADLAATSRPDLIFVFLFEDDLDPAVVRAVTETKRAPTLTWFGDDHWRFQDFSRRWAPSFSHVATTFAPVLPAYRDLGVTPLLTQWAAAERHRPQGLPLRQDVSFVGQAYGSRPKTVATLRDAGLSVGTRGYGWGLSPRLRRVLLNTSLRPVGGGAVAERLSSRTRCDQQEMITTFETSRVNLNLSEASQGGDRQIKGRVFEVPAAGGFLLTGPADGLAEVLEPGLEMDIAESPEEFVDKTRWWLAHESQRQAAAVAGRLRVDREHRYAHRFSALFTEMGLPS